MHIRSDVSLKNYSTMRLGGQAAHLTEASSSNELAEAVAWAEERQLPILVIGGGSNIIWKDEGFPGLVVVNSIMGYDEQKQDDGQYLVTIGAGENWTDIVERTVNEGLTGIEALALIPGTAGATPVQNVGAYGQEIAQTLVSVEAFDLRTKTLVTIKGDECSFGYRTSRFKTRDRGRFFITRLTLRLRRGNPEPPYYNAVQQYLDEHHIAERTPRAISDAVKAIRSAKLPDPKLVANNGSFFANPIISVEQLHSMQSGTDGDVPNWPAGEGKVKIPAAWLLERAGFKDVHDAETGMGTWPKQPLVLVNEHAEHTAQLLVFKQKVVSKVQELFGITLEQEPELLP